MGERLPLAAGVCFYVLLLYAGLLLFSINYLAIGPGLDPSWAFALNQFAHGPEIFGTDIVLTYGPLAYLAVPQHIGSNLQIAAVIHIVVWGTLLYLLIAYWESGKRAGAIFFTIGLICSNRLYYSYWDYLLNVISILALLLLLEQPANVPILLVLAAMTGLSFLVKFTAFILAVLLLCLYTVSRLVHWRRVSRREGTMLGLAFAAGPIAYLVYNPSLSGLIGYVQGSVNMSSGYSAVMSTPPEPDLVWRAAVLLGAILVCTGWAAWRRWIGLAGASMVLATSWVAFKHGYVRSDSAHAAMFFCFLILAMGFLLAQITYTTRRFAVFGLVFAAFTAFALQGASMRWPVGSSYWWAPGTNLAQAAQLLHWKQAMLNLDEARDDALRSAPINDYTPTLGRSRVLIFPWDVSYGAHQAFTTVPLYATQAYSAYTHFLDEQSARHLTRGSTPIDYIFLEWKSVDGRNPFLDVPATWNAMFSGFAPVSSQGDMMLLKRRSNPLAVTFQEIATSACPVADWAEVPQRATPVALSLTMPPTLVGKLITTAYQLGSVILQVQTRSGLDVSIRIPPDVVSYPFPINYLPLNSIMLNALWKDNVMLDPVVKFRLNGPGLPLLQCSANFYDVLGTTIAIR